MGLFFGIHREECFIDLITCHGYNIDIPPDKPVLQ